MSALRISNSRVFTVRGDPYGENAEIGNPEILRKLAGILRILHFRASPTYPHLLKNLKMRIPRNPAQFARIRAGSQMWRKSGSASTVVSEFEYDRSHGGSRLALGPRAYLGLGGWEIKITPARAFWSMQES